ncbi:MAG: hypothetical protein LDLANPLL_00333 [Turneriella sp.]|nr:hypothetical protein [Turneriella sp.]
MLSDFAKLATREEDGRLSVIFEGEVLPFYSTRSKMRDVAHFLNVLSQTPNEKTPIIVAPFTFTLQEIFSTPRRFYWISPVSFGAPTFTEERLVATDIDLQKFLMDVESVDKFSIYIAPQWKNATGYVEEKIRHILVRSAVRLKTIGYFARLWQINLRVNASAALCYASIDELKNDKPNFLVMAGPSLDATFREIKNTDTVWCADTALGTLVGHGIFPRVVFSVDAGFASNEHFVGFSSYLKKSILVADVTGSPAVQRLPFARILSFASSNPLVVEFILSNKLTWLAMENHSGDVGTLVQNTYKALFPNTKIRVLGHDGKHHRYVTHARGSAYFTRTYAKQNRLFNAETYMFKLSRRYNG